MGEYEVHDYPGYEFRPEVTPGNISNHYSDHYLYDYFDLANYGDYTHPEYDDHYYEIFDFEAVIYGYLWPIIVIFTACCNLLVIGGFLRERMRNPTTLILVFIAVSDSLTGLVTLPATFYVFTDQRSFLSANWCNVTMITRLYISRAFHTASIWQTVLLAAHRMLQVRYPGLAEKICTTRKTLAAVAGIYVFSFLLHVFHAFDIKADQGMCQWELKKPCGWACVYIWASLILVHVIPSILLSGLALRMWRSLSTINHNSPDTTTRRTRQQSRKITLVVIAIVVIFLIPELPFGIFYLMTMIFKHTKNNILPLRTNRILHATYEVALVVSFHLNFWVYCVLYRDFRACLIKVLKRFPCRFLSSSHSQDETMSSSGRDQELIGMTSETTYDTA